MKLSTNNYLIEIDTSGGSTTLNVIDLVNQISYSELASTAHFNFADKAAALIPPADTALEQARKVFMHAQEKFDKTYVELKVYKDIDTMGALDDPADLTDKIADFIQVQQEYKTAKAAYEALNP